MKLTDALIRTVVEAENRQNGLLAHPNDATGYSASEGQDDPISQPDAEASRLAGLAERVSPTPTEQAEAWERNHCDYEPPDE